MTTPNQGQQIQPPDPSAPVTSQTEPPRGTQQPPGTESVQTTPPEFNTWTRELPFDSADFLEKPLVPVIDAGDKAKMDAVRKYEQSLAGQGVELLTPSFPELFPNAPKPKDLVSPKQGGDTLQPDESEMDSTAPTDEKPKG